MGEEETIHYWLVDSDACEGEVLSTFGVLLVDESLWEVLRM